MNPPSQSPEKQDLVAAGDCAEESLKPKPTTLKRFMDKVGLDASALIIMFKGSIPPTIAISMYQSTVVSTYFTTQGYLIAIISVLAVAILPRDKFIQNLIFNLLAMCVGSAMSLLALWSSIQARIHTSSPSTSESTAGTSPPYNSSQSAVCAVWLFANVWLANFLRARVPSSNMAMVIYSILVTNSMTFGPMVATTAAAEAFVREQLLAMLFGLALATGTSLLIFPVSSRMVAMGEFKGLIGLLRKMVGQQQEYLAGLAGESIVDVEAGNAVERDGARVKKKWEAKQAEKKARERGVTGEARVSRCLKETVGAMRVLVGKLYGDMVFAKRDVAWGKLDATDLDETFKLLRNITIPMVAINTTDAFQRLAKPQGWYVNDDTPADIMVEKIRGNQVWEDVMKQVHTKFQILAEVIDQGLEHAGICLEILPKLKVSKKSRRSGSGHVDADIDIEACSDETKPGNERFSSFMDKKLQQLYSRTGKILQTLKSPPAADEASSTHPKHTAASDSMQRDQAQLYVVLYMERLTCAAGEAIQDLVAFADQKVEDGTMTQKRLLFPSGHLLRDWWTGIFKEDSSVEESSDIIETNHVHYGDSYKKKKDPERLPATTTWQHVGNGLYKISDVLGSKESAFGLRVACATMTIGILAFLEQTQVFFHNQRLSWAMITIALGMTITSGQSVFGFLCRVGATCLGMVVSLVIWYIVDQQTAGVIVFLWLFIFIEYYFFKFPQLIPAVMITVTTQIVIIGYELQVRRLGEAVATKTGQPYYPTYLLAPYRLAVVAGGTLVAFFWTVFPCPLTDRSWLRLDLSATTYLTASDFHWETSAAHRLAEARRGTFSKVMRRIYSVESHLKWQRWEPTIGGRFPVETYREIMVRSEHILGYLTLLSYALTHPPRTHVAEKDPDNEQTDDQAAGPSDADIDTQDNRWWGALANALRGVEPTYHAVLLTLTLLSNSLLSGLSLPPITGRLVEVPKDGHNSSSGHGKPGPNAVDISILDARNRNLRGYAEFVVIQACGTLVSHEVQGLLRAVSRLVGVEDFSIRVDEGSVHDSVGETVEKQVEGDYGAMTLSPPRYHGWK
ncbi:hypothetical protein GE09DRAFT_979456 [Coniochaeta sp. 2T2.1]|nr:hypothetical protein GE09DRAFT_979456 [Coniochaeta sp. 2T2.1]